MRLLLTPLALLCALVPAAPAAAATVSYEQTTVTIAAPDRERNQITVTGRSGGGVTVRDARTPVTPGPGCTQTRPDRVACGGQVTDLAADLGPLRDSISVGDSAPVRGILRGGSGNDTLRGGVLNDLIAGGMGRDTVRYTGRTEDVLVTLAGGADDGRAGEGDDVGEVERAVGGNGFDTLIGSGYGNALYGGRGDDRLDGGVGIDTLAGGRGNDLLQGGDGDDTFRAERTPDGSDALQGGEGRDHADYSRRSGHVVVDPDGFADDGERPGGSLTFTGLIPPFLLLSSPERDNVLPDVESVTGGGGDDVVAPSNGGGVASGGPGTDVVYGGPGRDVLGGDAGFDRVIARDGRADAVRCGTEVDRVWLDLDDLVDADCEQRSTTFSPRVGALSRTLDDEGLRVRVECPPTAFVACNGTLRATTIRRVDGRRRARLGFATFGMVPGASEEVVIGFGDDARAIVARFRPLRVRIAARGRDEAGTARPAAARLVLRG